MKRNFAQEIIVQLDDETSFRYHEALNVGLIDGAALLDALQQKDRDRIMDLVAAIPGGRLEDAARQFVSWLEAERGLSEDFDADVAFWTRKFQAAARAHAEHETECLAQQCEALAEVQPQQAQHYTKAAHYLRSGEVSVQRTPHGFTIQHERNTVHRVVLNGKPHGNGVERHTCTCQNRRVCWARALAQALVTRERIRQGARKLAVLRGQVSVAQVARVVAMQVAA